MKPALKLSTYYILGCKKEPREKCSIGTYMLQSKKVMVWVDYFVEGPIDLSSYFHGLKTCFTLINSSQYSHLLILNRQANREGSYFLRSSKLNSSPK